MAKKKKLKTIKPLASNIDFSMPYEGTVGKSKSRQIADRIYDSKVTPEERKLGSELFQDADGNYIRRTKTMSKAKAGAKVSRRQQPYRLGLPTRYTDPEQGKDIEATVEEDAANKKVMAEEYKKGKKISPFRFLKRTEAKKGAKVKAKPLNESTKATLRKKAKSSGISYGTLVKVYRRGQGAWLSSGSRRGASMAAWAMGRVNSYIRGSKKHDTDLR